MKYSGLSTVWHGHVDAHADPQFGKLTASGHGFAGTVCP
jgi:hypothetical protein